MRESPNESLFSKIFFVVAMVVLIAIIGGCTFVLYGYFVPGSDTGTATPTPTPRVVGPANVSTTRITPYPTPPPTPTPVPGPTLQIQPTPVVTETPQTYEFDVRITDGLKIASPPGIWDRYIVYDEIDGTGYKVHLYDISALSDTVIDSGNFRCFGAIGSGKVALENLDNNLIYLYDIQAKTKQLAVPDKNIPREYPNIFDNILIYTGNDGSYNPIQGRLDIFSVYSFMMADSTYNLWSANVPEPNELRGSGNYIVWWHVVDGVKQIVLYNIRAISGSVISPAGVNCDHPRIAGTTVVYHSSADGQHRVSMYDLNTGSTKPVASLGRQYSADINGDNIVFDDNREGNWNIYVYNKATRREKQITSESHDQMSPQIYGDNVIYMNNKNGNWDIYMMRI